MEVSDSSRVIDVAWVSGRGSPLTVGLRNDAPVHCALPFRFFRFSSYHDLLIICVLFQPKKYFNAARFHRLSSPTTKSTSRLVVASFERNGQVRAVEVEAEEKQHILTNPRLGAPTGGWCGV